jgi:hypothetical protein
MNGEAIAELANRFREPQLLGDLLVRPNDWTVSDPESHIAAGPAAHALTVATLGAVRDYLVANRDGLDLAHVVVHVESPSRVSVLGPLAERSRTRETFLTAGANDLTDGFLGRYWPLAEFLIALQTRFADADDRATLLKLLANVKHEQVKQAIDDGMTQVVSARVGVVMVSDVAVPNPVLLTPFRTFRDVIQPSCLFVLRVQSGKVGGLPEAGLWEADGGAWRLTAVERVRAWLEDGLTGLDTARVAVLG